MVVLLAYFGRSDVPCSHSIEQHRGVVIALLLALGSSLAYGCADFLGGLGAAAVAVGLLALT
ncbi:hypothetical protein GCM10009525_74780 [Streptosporangium amethystogenes subsp. fukuiense]